MLRLFISSYDKQNKGIYTVYFDEKHHTFRIVAHLPTDDYPAYLITSNNKLYVAFKHAIRTNNGGGLGAYSIEGDILQSHFRYYSSGRSYTHLCLSKDEQYLFGANYHAGSVASYQLKGAEIIYKIGAVHHTGLGPDLLQRQLGPHVHYVGITPDQNYVYAVDLGSDKIVFYPYPNGVLDQENSMTTTVTPGSGPRHMIFSRDGNFAYLVNEINNTVVVFSYNNATLTQLQTVTCTLGCENTQSSAAAIKLSSSGNHLFVSNRGVNTICIYRVNKMNGKIALLDTIQVKAGPRDFTLVHDQYLFVACQDDHCIQVFEFNEQTETICQINSSIEILSPVCITQ